MVPRTRRRRHLPGPPIHWQSGRLRLVATRANTQPALAVYSRDGAEHQAFAIKLLTLHNGLISQITEFVDPELFIWFALPTRRPFNYEKQPSTPN